MLISFYPGTVCRGGLDDAGFCHTASLIQWCSPSGRGTTATCPIYLSEGRYGTNMSPTISWPLLERANAANASAAGCGPSFEQQDRPPQLIVTVLDRLLGRFHLIDHKQRDADSIGDCLKRNSQRGIGHRRCVAGHGADRFLIRLSHLCGCRNLTDNPHSARGFPGYAGSPDVSISWIARSGPPRLDHRFPTFPEKIAAACSVVTAFRGFVKSTTRAIPSHAMGICTKSQSVCPATAKSASRTLTM